LSIWRIVLNSPERPTAVVSGRPFGDIAGQGSKSMKLWITVSALVVVLSGSVIGQTEPVTTSAPKIDPEADKVLRAMSEQLVRCKSFRVDVDIVSSYKLPGDSGEEAASYRVGMERPNRFAAWLTSGQGATLVCDGKDLYVYWDRLAAYKVEGAPPTVRELHLDDKTVGDGSLLGLLGMLVTSDPYVGIMGGVRETRYLGVEEIDGDACSRVHGSQDDMEWDIWIQSGEQAVIRKLDIDLTKGRPVDGYEGGVTATFDGWGLDRDLPAAAFTFVAPEGAVKVDSFFERDDDPNPADELLGKPAPEFKLPLLSGGTVDLAKLKGKVVILDFWATWCGPCRKGLPALADLAKQYGSKGLLVYAVNLRERPEQIRSFLTKLKLELPVALDEDATVADRYKVSGIPQTVLVDAQGVVQAVHVGYYSGVKRKLLKQVEALLAGKKLVDTGPTSQKGAQETQAAGGASDRQAD